MCKSAVDILSYFKIYLIHVRSHQIILQHEESNVKQSRQKFCGKRSSNIHVKAATQTVKLTGSCWTAKVAGLEKANIGLCGLGSALWIRKQWGCERGSFRVLSAHRLRPSLLDNLQRRPKDRFHQRDTTKPRKPRCRHDNPPPQITEFSCFGI